MASETTLISAPKVKSLVKAILPAGYDSKVHVREVGGYAVIEIVTDAWKRQPFIKRIQKVDEALRQGLTRQQSANILRVAVMTAEEQEDIKALHRGEIAPARTSRRRRLSASGK